MYIGITPNTQVHTRSLSTNNTSALFFTHDCPRGSLSFISEEPHPDKHQHDQHEHADGRVLLDQQIPIDLDSGLAVLPTIVPQPRAHLAHALEAVAAVQQVLDVLGHDLGDVAQLVVEAVEVLGGAGVGVQGLGAADEGVELHEGVGPQGGRVQLLRRVRLRELGRQVRQVREGQLARVRPLADADVHHVRRDHVVQREGPALDAGLLLGVAVQPAEDDLGLRLDFGEGGFCLYAWWHVVSSACLWYSIYRYI